MSITGTIFKKVLSFVSSKALSVVTGGATSYWKYVAIAAVAAGLMSWSYEKGVAKSDKVIAQYKIDAEKNVDKLGEITVPVLTQIITKYVTRTVTIHDNANTNALIIANEVPDKGILSEGWVSTHDAAAQGLAVDPFDARNVAPS